MRLCGVLLLIWVVPVVGRSKRHKTDSQWKARKRECQVNVELCGGMIEEERGNCVAKCISEECWEEVYGHDPLEDGELDPERGRSFTSCTRRKYREQKKLRERERRESRANNNNQHPSDSEDVSVLGSTSLQT